MSPVTRLLHQFSFSLLISFEQTFTCACTSFQGLLSNLNSFTALMQHIIVATVATERKGTCFRTGNGFAHLRDVFEYVIHRFFFFFFFFAFFFIITFITDVL